jgi:hypothetical protein
VRTVLVDGVAIVDAGEHHTLDRATIASSLAESAKAQASDPDRARFAARMRALADEREAWSRRPRPHVDGAG